MGATKHKITPIRPQLHLFDDLPIILNDKFLEYHAAFPQVYNTFKKLTLEAIKKRKHKHFSARGIFQVMRFFRKDGIKDDGFKYNNNYTPYYVRMFEKEHPEHIGFFEKRKTKYSTVA